MKKFLSISLTLSAILMSGCNSSSSDKTENSSDSEVVINVQRGSILGGFIKDSNGVRAKEIGEGKYSFSKAPTYPIYSEGGYIDVDGNGEVNSGDIVMKYNLSTQKSNNITLLTTLSQNQNMKNYFLENLNISEDELYQLPSENPKVSAISDELYRYCVENNINLNELKEENLSSLNSNFQNRINSYQNMKQNGMSNSQIAIKNEQNLVQNLNCQFVDEANIIDANEVSNNANNYSLSNISNTSTIYNLSDEQRDDLLFMYEEEKLARDVYLSMYEKWGLNTFLNISYSEETHISSIKTILDKYSIPNEIKERGIFNNSELQNLYNSLIAEGSLSIKDAVAVGIKIEELDISDLELRITRANEDAKVVFENLKDGSNKHLSAFIRVYDRL